MHVVTGADHVAVLAPFSVEAQRRAWTVGLRWGAGHSVGIVAVALALLYARDWLGVWFLAVGPGDYLVAGVLVAVGLWGLWHGRGAAQVFERESVAHRHVHATAALSIGTLHGLVGTGATLAVLPAVALGSLAESAAFLTGFSLGTIVSMSGIAWLLGVLAPRDELGVAYRRVFLAASFLSLAVGLVWLGLTFAGVDVHGG
jgi:hypothetical protein